MTTEAITPHRRHLHERTDRMTPERLQEMRTRFTRGVPMFAVSGGLDLLDYVDLLHEDLRITREERGAEKKKAMQRAKDHAREKAEAWEQGLSAGFHATNFYVAPRNPYRLDTQEEA